MNLSQFYIDSLSKKISKGLGKECNIKGVGISEKVKEKLIENDYPQELIELLEIKNGFSCPVIGFKNSDYAYNLFSAEEMLIENLHEIVREIYEYDEDDVDKRIKVDGELKWIPLGEDVYNNGGCTKIYIDMTPSESGVKGQVVVYDHDPDCFKVVANSFREFLFYIMMKDFDYIDDHLNDPEEFIRFYLQDLQF